MNGQNCASGDCDREQRARRRTCAVVVVVVVAAKNITHRKRDSERGRDSGRANDEIRRERAAMCVCNNFRHFLLG